MTGRVLWLLKQRLNRDSRLMMELRLPQPHWISALNEWRGSYNACRVTSADRLSKATLVARSLTSCATGCSRP